MEVQTLHKTLEHEMQIEEEKLKETKKNYNPTSERIFHSTSDLSDSQEDDNIIKILCKGWTYKVNPKTKTIFQSKQ